MQVTLSILFGFLSIVLANPHSEGVPTITLDETRSINEIPTINIRFPNGHEDTLLLERFYSSDEERMAKVQNCNFFGHLAKDSEACVAVTGCPGSEDLEFTINSRHSGPSNMYILRKDGTLEVIESTFKNPKIVGGAIKLRGDQNKTFHLMNGDELVNDEELQEQMEIAELCNSGNCNQIPSTNLMKIKIGYDDSWYNDFNGDMNAINSFLNSMMTHVQTFFCSASLGTKIQVERVGDFTYHSGQTWRAEPNYNSFGNHIRGLTASSSANANLWVYMCKDPNYSGVVGLAYVGTLCESRSFQCSINERRSNVVTTAEVVTHEIGHNLGMLHDFDDTHSGKGCNGQGFMSYGSHPYQWSSCSVSDLNAHFQRHYRSWCLPSAPNACGGSTATKCTPWYGRFIPSGYINTFANIPSWEDCGKKCQEDSNCQSWTWNVPDNACSGSGCKECVLSGRSITLSDTTQDKNWITGQKSCFSSAGTSSQSCAGVCTPWYGRIGCSNHIKAVSNIQSWEECGRRCQGDSGCVTWTWNVPDNSCSGSGCKECVLCGNSIPISGTTPNKDWISGLKSCYLSAGSTSCLQRIDGLNGTLLN